MSKDLNKQQTEPCTMHGVGSRALSDWNEKVIRAKIDFAIAFTKWVNSPEHKKMIEYMKRLGAIR